MISVDGKRINRLYSDGGNLVISCLQLPGGITDKFIKYDTSDGQNYYESSSSNCEVVGIGDERGSGLEISQDTIGSASSAFIKTKYLVRDTSARIWLFRNRDGIRITTATTGILYKALSHNTADSIISESIAASQLSWNKNYNNTGAIEYKCYFGGSSTPVAEGTIEVTDESSTCYQITIESIIKSSAIILGWRLSNWDPVNDPNKESATTTTLYQKTINRSTLDKWYAAVATESSVGLISVDFQPRLCTQYPVVYEGLPYTLTYDLDGGTFENPGPPYAGNPPPSSQTFGYDRVMSELYEFSPDKGTLRKGNYIAVGWQVDGTRIDTSTYWHWESDKTATPVWVSTN